MVIISKIIFSISNNFELNPDFLLPDLNILMVSLNPSMITSGDEVVLCEGWNHILNMENNISNKYKSEQQYFAECVKKETTPKKH